MSMALWQEVKALRRTVEEMKRTAAPSGPFPFERLDELEKKVKEMENKYRMLNARVSRKSE